MPCKQCQSSNQNVFEGEISIHFRELERLKKLPVLSFEPLIICMDCGFIESRLADGELQELIQRRAGKKDTAD